MESQDREEINSVSFSQNQQSFALATNKGFWIYTIYPEFMKQIKRTFKGGISIV
jgi:WD40 repeat protein